MHKDGQLDIAEWSLYSLEQRLMAGAMGVGFLPTKSLMGTSMGEENADSFKVTTDPFDESVKIGVVKALVPDISFIHGCVADAEGNVILAPPYFASIWGSRASKGGVVVTVEKVVSTDFIRKHSSLVKVPGHLVKFVCPVSFGSHPQGLAAESIGITEGYAEDYEFIRTFVNSSQDETRLKKWLETWVIGCPDREDYLRKLGSDRITFLKGKSSSNEWKPVESSSDSEGKPAFNSTERMIVAAAGEIKSNVKEKGHKIMLAGIGSPGLAAWLAYYLLKKEGQDIDLLTGLGQVGYAPRPGDPFLMSLPNVMTCTMLTDTMEVYGTFVGGAHNRCLSVLGTAQIDQYGNINTVKIGDTPFIGSGGAGDAVNARETLVIAKQSRRRFMEKLPYVSCPGQSISTLATDLGIFKKLGDDETFTLTKILGDLSEVSKEDQLREIRERCGWEVRVAATIDEIPLPTSDELAILRALDPEGLFIGK